MIFKKILIHVRTFVNKEFLYINLINIFLLLLYIRYNQNIGVVVIVYFNQM